MPSFGDDVIVAADFPSIVPSCGIDINHFDVICTGMRRNTSPAGLTLVIVCEDLLGKASVARPSIFNYTMLGENDSMSNTLPMFA